uniref:Uncharacterized protein n=1 Tax=Ascaris lumbricoides TaxID=6252 RepID=A0A0M3I6X3_ASCLU
MLDTLHIKPMAKAGLIEEKSARSGDYIKFGVHRLTGCALMHALAVGGPRADDSDVDASMHVEEEGCEK